MPDSDDKRYFLVDHANKQADRGRNCPKRRVPRDLRASQVVRPTAQRRPTSDERGEKKTD